MAFVAGMLVGLVPAPAYADAPTVYDTTVAVEMNVTTAFYYPAYDVDGDPLTYEILTSPAHGVVVDCDGQGGCYYDPDPGFVGRDSLTFRANDGSSNSASAVVTFEVTDPDGGVANDVWTTVAEQTPTELQLSGYDGTSATFGFEIVTLPSRGTLGSIGTPDCSTPNSCTAPVTYTSGASTAGMTDTFTYRTVDSGGHRSLPATVTLDILAVEPPTAYGNFLEVGRDGTTTLTLSGSDPFGRSLTFEVLDAPAHGSLSAFGTPSCDGYFCEATTDYTTSGYDGLDSFTFTVSAGGSTSAPATVDLSVVEAPCAGQTITNGTIKLGVNCKGELNVGDVGVEFVPTGNDSTSPGCPCEGWGLADATSSVTGYANQSAGTSANLSLVSFTTTATTAVSVTEVGSTYRITHDYHPSTATPNAYEVTVTVQNISAASTAVRYRRVMDWDIEPTAFSEFVTLQKGTSSDIVFTSNDGFASSDPLAGPSDIGFTGNFTDAGPSDHGALFDFDFGSLAPGATRTFDIYYGAAEHENGALYAINAVKAEAYSLGQPSTPDGPSQGTPNTFFFGFKRVGGVSPFAPNAVNDSVSAVSGTATPVNVLANDTDPNPGDTLTVISKTNPSHGTVTCTTSSCTYTSTPGYVGPDSFTYTISDGTGGSDTATVSVTVTPPVNSPPDAVADSLTTPEDTPGTLTVLANDTDPNGDPLSVTGYAQGAHGSVSCTPAGTCTYTPAANYAGPDSFAYTISDGHGGSDSATVSVTVTPVNDAPVAVPDTTSTAEDTAKVIAVTSNDSDVEGSPLTATAMTQPSHGTASCSGGSCTYTPAPNYNGPDSFTYRVSDGALTSNTVTVSITVTPVNDAPVAAADTTSTAEDTAKVIAVTSNDTDVDNDLLSAQVVALPTHGSVSCSGGSCTYTPAPNYNGPDSFTYRASDGGLLSAPVSVSITVTPVNDAPVATDDSASAPGPVLIPVLTNDTDVDGDPLAIVGNTLAAHGTVDCSSTSCSYTPTAGFTGQDSFTYTISDGTLTDAATVTVAVGGGTGAPPEGVDDVLTVNEDSPGSLDVLENDTEPDGQAMSVTDWTQPDGGTVTCTAAGTCTYTPNPNFHGDDNFQYYVSDPGGLFDVVTVVVTVNSVNDSPVAVDDALTLNEDSTKSVSVLVNDTDVDGDALSLVSRTSPAHGTVTCTAAGVCTYKPAANYYGPDSFTYTVSDGHGGTDVGKVWITVKPVADRPGAPTIGTASSGALGGAVTATARWSAPASNGGSPITAYKVKALKLNAAGVVVSSRIFTVGPAKRSHKMTLAPGRYKFRVAAVNAVGIGPFSAASNIVRAR